MVRTRGTIADRILSRAQGQGDNWVRLDQVFDYWVLRCCRIVTSLGYQTVCEPEGEGAIFEREIACVLGHWQLRR